MEVVAYVFPGQGSQSVGMARQLADSSGAARAVFAEADAALGEPISRLAWDGPAEELDRTENAQPALLAASIAFLRALEEAWAAAGTRAIEPAFCAGHSMGQYSAMVAAGVISLADGVRLVRERGRLMQAASGDGAMAAVIGLADEHLAELEAAGQAAGVFAIANRNSPGQVVVSGQRRAVEVAAEAARGMGAKRAIVLPVSVAAHSPLMTGAAEGMRRAIEGVEFRDPEVPLLANADARRLTTGEACRAELIEHLTRGVDWIAAVNAMLDEGVRAFVEVGPGRVLSGLVRRIAPEARAVAVDDPAAPRALALDAVELPETIASPA
ncbi:MAG TPA: ACP S-malonyltransferase [Candidatus Limnocylindrales bacterium]|nr:ACP S-malonyltransferase [Candidatus Limnocylindrales bacterium]